MEANERMVMDSSFQCSRNKKSLHQSHSGKKYNRISALRKQQSVFNHQVLSLIFSCTHESTDITDVAQLAKFICGIEILTTWRNVTLSSIDHTEVLLQIYICISAQTVAFHVSSVVSGTYTVTVMALQLYALCSPQFMLMEFHQIRCFWTNQRFLENPPTLGSRSTSFLFSFLEIWSFPRKCNTVLCPLEITLTIGPMLQFNFQSYCYQNCPIFKKQLLCTKPDTCLVR